MTAPTPPPPLAAQSDLRASRSPLAGLSAMGAIWGALAAMLPALRAQTEATDAALGAVFLFASLVSVAAMLAAPRIGVALGGRALPLSTAAMVAALLLPGMAGTVWALALALAALGAASGVNDVLMNGRVAEVEAARGRPLMNLNHAGYSLSFFAGAVLAGLARDAGAAPILVFAVLALGLAPLVWLTRDAAPGAAQGAASGAARGTPAALVPAADGAPPAPTVSDGTATTARPACPAGGQAVAPTGMAAARADVQGLWLLIALGGALIALASLVEASTETWSALHLERTLGAGPALAALGPALMGLCMGLGRLAGQGLSRRLRPQALIAGGAVLASAGAGLAALAPGPALALAGIAALGFGASVLIPTALTLMAAAAPPERRTDAIARAYAMGFLGYVAGPAGMGVIAEAASLRLSFLTLALGALLILPLVLPLARRARG